MELRRMRPARGRGFAAMIFLAPPVFASPPFTHFHALRALFRCTIVSKKSTAKLKKARASLPPSTGGSRGGVGAVSVRATANRCRTINPKCPADADPEDAKNTSQVGKPTPRAK